MDFVDYRALLSDRLSAYFDISTENTAPFARWDVVARHAASLSQTFLGKSNVIDYLETAEWCLVRESSGISAETINAEKKALEALIPQIVRPSRNHKSTLISSIIVVRSLDRENQETRNGLRAVRRFRRSVPHRLFFHGWTDLGIAIVDLGAETVIASPAAKRQAKALAPKNLSR